MWDWSTRELSGWRGFSALSWKGCLCSCFAFERAAHLAAAHEPARVVEGGEGQALEETVEEQKLLAAPVILAESVVEQINPLEDHASVTDRGAAMMTNANAGQYDEVKIGMTGAATSTLLRAISHHAFPSSITPTHAVVCVLLGAHACRVLIGVHMFF